jgi:hypothetical protein
MLLKSSSFITLFALFLVFFPQQASPIVSDDIAMEWQPIAAPKAAAGCWQDDPRGHLARLGWNNDPLAKVRMSYNKRTRTCLIEIAFRIVVDEDVVLVSRSLGNTEGREYANYIWSKADPAHPGELSAMYCQVILSSGEQLDCHSESEFDEIESSLMN